MASILRSSRLVYSVIGFSRRSGSLTGKKKKVLLKDCREIFNFNELKIRTAAVAAEKQIPQDNSFTFEKSIYQLSVDLKRQHVSRNDFYNAFEAVKKKGELKYSQLTLLLRCCSDVSFTLSEEDRIKMAKSIWKFAEDCGTEITVNHYNALLEVFVINHYKFSPKDFLDSLKAANIEANSETYRLLLKAYCSQGDIEGAGSILNLMKQLDLPLNRDDFNSLIQGHCEIGNIEKAAEILKVMQERNIKPLSDSYVYLLCGYAKHGRIDELKEMLDDLSTKNIYLLDSEFLEVIYTLAVNNHDKHVNEILERVLKERGYITVATRYIIRLFEKRKDALAVELYKTLNKAENLYNGVSLPTKCVLDFFVSYRNPKDLLCILDEMIEKENIENIILYTLNASLQTKNENFFMGLLELMKTQGIKIKKHYYWPVLIQACKKGNSEIFATLSRTTNTNLLRDYDTLVNIILRNHKFDSNWKVDFDKFIKLGADIELLTRYVAEIFILKKKFNEVEDLVSTYPVNIYNLRRLLFKLFKNVENNVNDNQSIVNILYYLAHDFKREKLVNNEMENNIEDENEKDFSLFDNAVKVLLSFSYSEEVNRDLLEKMLEKKMRLLNSSSVDLSRQSTGLIEIINKLADPGLEFEWDNNIIEKKNSFVTLGRPKSNFLREIKFSDGENLKTLVRKFDCSSLDEFLPVMLELAGQNQFEDAIKICQHLSESGKEVQNTVNARLLYKRFLSQFIQKKNEPVLLESAFDLGVKLGILQMRDYSLVIRSYLRSNEPLVAVEKFCDHALCSGELAGCIELLKELISLGKTEEVDKVMAFVTKLISREVSVSFLFVALVSTGQVDQAIKLCKDENVELDRNIIRRNCAIWFKNKNSEFFEKIMEVLKDIKNLDRRLLYRILIHKYLEENQMDAIQQLFLEMKNDHSLSNGFLNEMENFIKNPDSENSSQFLNNIDPETRKISVAKNSKRKLFRHLMEKQDYDQAFILVISNEVPSFLGALLLDTLASQGKVSQVLDLLSRSRLERYTKRTAAEFLKAGKVNEYFQFLSHFVAEGKINKLSDIFKIHNLLPSLKKDDAFLTKYKAFALQCLEEANMVMPLISYFVECVKTPEKLKEAENLFEKYTDVMKKVPFQVINDIAGSTKEAAFYQNILTSEKLKSYFSENLSTFYNKIISLNLRTNNFNSAARYLEMAEADGLKEHLDKNLTTLLEKKLTENKKNMSSENSKATSD